MDGNRGVRLTDKRGIFTAHGTRQPTALSGEIQQSTIPWKINAGENPDICRQGSGIVR
jgi:hypothetical protein